MTSISLRLPKALKESLKGKAAAAGLTFSGFLRRELERLGEIKVPPATAKTQAWLSDLLESADGSGWDQNPGLPANLVHESARWAGISKEELQAAARALGVEKVRLAKHWYWRLK